ncbi:hypothetical protein KIPB_002635 [Kipferlia bialata]|uniref:Uncharacterized protein n=1 Tax=Kipferlia bialata TaxID=797122 RepID=A0A9K3CR39_9EUKA|nr:hypothetical protein KIPB_002635 [Kipferlia bialata]|eukprot:g2635.t1
MARKAVKKPAKRRKPLKGYESTHIPAECWGEDYPSLEALLTSVQRGSGRQWRESVRTTGCIECVTDKDCKGRVGVAQKPQGWRLTGVKGKHSCEVMHAKPLQYKRYTLPVPTRNHEWTCLAYLSPTEILCKYKGTDCTTTMCVVTMPSTEDTVHGNHVEAECTLEDMPCPYPMPPGGDWANPSHFQRVGTDLYHLCDQGFFKLDCASRPREWCSLGAVTGDLDAILNPKIPDIPRSLRLLALEGDLYLLAQCNLEVNVSFCGYYDGEAHFWRYNIDSADWECLPSATLPINVNPATAVVLGSRLHCTYRLDGLHHSTGGLSYRPPPNDKDSLANQSRGSYEGWVISELVGTEKLTLLGEFGTGASFPDSPVPLGRYIMSASMQGFYDTVTDESSVWSLYGTRTASVCEALRNTFGPREGAVYTSLMTDHATGCTIEDVSSNKEVYLQVVQFDTDALVL